MGIGEILVEIGRELGGDWGEFGEDWREFGGDWQALGCIERRGIYGIASVRVSECGEVGVRW